ncbi:MAG TPA: DUF6134 family protein [Telmatospirillum sp.]|nr:DUF6134 family protein [Telmatospirillum sp.]
MPTHPLLVRSLSALAFVLLPGIAQATPSPAETHLDFTVLKNGSPIGHHWIDLIRNGDNETVSIKTNILVRMAYVPVYRFEHTGSEVWQHGHLVSLRSQTNDDGEEHSLVVGAKNDHIEIDGDGLRSQADSGIIPASLWNHDLVTQGVLLNTLTGKQMPVRVDTLGEEPVSAHGTETRALHYRVTGELQRDLWYDRSGTLVQVKFKAKDASDILYVLE